MPKSALYAGKTVLYGPEVSEETQYRPEGIDMRIVMATTPTCTLCPIIMKRLDSFGITYEAVDLAVDDALKTRVVEELGKLQSPVFLLLDGDDNATATVVDHLGAYSKNELLQWNDQVTSMAA